MEGPDRCWSIIGCWNLPRSGLVQQRLGEVTLRAPFTSQAFQIRWNRSVEGRDTANVQAQASTPDGLWAGQTEIIFNAPDDITDILLELRPVEDPDSEFERLVTSLTPLMEGVDIANLTDEQINILAGGREGQRTLITTWHEAAIVTRDTGLPIAAVYGWFRRLRQPHTLAGLLAQDESLLRTILERSIRSNIILDISDQIDSILARLNSLQPRVVFGTFTFDPPSREPITSGVIVQAFDRDFRSEQLLGEVLVPGPFGLPGSSTTGSYRIEYTEAQFQQNEARTADPFVRARTVDGRYTAE